MSDWREILKECADDLEGWVEAHYEKTKDYPSEMRRYVRDIAPVVRARELLNRHPAPQLRHSMAATEREQTSPNVVKND